MATVDGFTAARMLAMENATIINASLVSYNLILIRKDGTQINVGNVRGAQGLQGPQGPAVPLATNAEVNTGSVTDKAVTPAGLHQKLATISARGLVTLAAQAEVNDGSGGDKVVTATTLNGRTASSTRSGIVELATPAEVVTGTDSVRAVTPEGLHGKIASKSARGLTQFATLAQARAGIIQDLAVGSDVYAQGFERVAYSPTLTIWTIGTGGSISAWYMDSGQYIDVWIKATFGTGAVFTAASPRFSLPAGITSLYTGDDSRMLIRSQMKDTSDGPLTHGRGQCQTNTTISPMAETVTANTFRDLEVNSAVPQTWAATDIVTIFGRVYKA